MTEQPDLYDWQPLVDDLERRQAQALAMGGQQQVERQRGMGKLPVRERLELLLDPGSFVELGQLADSMDPALQAQRGYLAADGMVAGIGAIDGRRVAICAYDFTVLAGSMGAIGETRLARTSWPCASASPSSGCWTRQAQDPVVVGIDVRGGRRCCSGSR